MPTMKRVTMMGGLLAIGLLLAGCDKCGDPVKFFTPAPVKSCSDSKPAG